MRHQWQNFKVTTLHCNDYVGAIWETENHIKALKEIRGLVENMRG